jgi:hypothetical protein
LQAVIEIRGESCKEIANTDVDGFGLLPVEERVIHMKSTKFYCSLVLIAFSSVVIFSGCREVLPLEVNTPAPADCFTIKDGVLLEYEKSARCPREVSIPDGVTEIGDYAFSEKQLIRVQIPESVTRIGKHAFAGNQLTAVKIPDGVTEIEEWAFGDNRLGSALIPRGVKRIGAWAFAVNNLASVTLPQGVTQIDQEAFSLNLLSSVILPESVREIGDYAFSLNKIDSVVFSEGLNRIGTQAFLGNELTQVEIPRDCKVSSDSFDIGVRILRVL